jgi:DNA-directed RNA polymerase specialized sigma24 family protein
MRPAVTHSSGSTDDFATFYRSEFPAVVRLAYVLTYSAEYAEDIAQEAFARVHGRYEGLRNPASYLRVCVVNLTRESHRRRTTEERNLRRIPRPALSTGPGESDLLDVLRRLP